MRRWRTILLLLLVVGALGAYLVFKGKPPGPTPTATEPALRGHRFYDAHEIVIWPKPKHETEAIKIVRKQDDSGYWVREPLRDKASFALLQYLAPIFDKAVLLKGYDAEAVKNQPNLVVQCGLEKPARTIELHFRTDASDGKDDIVTLEMGGDAPMGDGIYVRRGDTIYRCPNKAPLSALNIQADDARERVLVDPWVMRTLRVCRVTGRSGDTVSELELTKKQMGEFWITKPGNMRADQAVVGNYLGAIQGLTVRRFLSGGVNTVIGPGQEPMFHIVLESDRGTEEIKIFGTAGAKEFWGYHTRRNIAFGIALKDGLTALEAKADLLRARVLLPIKREDMVRILLEPGGDEPKTDLRIGMGQVLKMREPVISSLHPSRLSELLQGLATMQVLEFLDDVDPDDHGLGKGAFRVSVQENRTRQTITLRLGKDDGEFTYVMREDEAYITRVPKANADKVRQRWVDLLDLRVTSLKQVPYRLEVSRDGKPRFVYRKVDGEWRADGDQKEDRKIQELVDDHLVELQGRRALEQPGDLGPPLVLKLFREAKSSDVLLDLRVWLRDGVVLVGAQLPGVVYEMNNSLLTELVARWLK